MSAFVDEPDVIDYIPSQCPAKLDFEDEGAEDLGEHGVSGRAEHYGGGVSGRVENLGGGVSGGKGGTLGCN